MSTNKRVLAAAVVLMATLAGCGSGDSGGDGSSDPLKDDTADKGTVVVGSNNFPESILLGDIYGEALKAKGLKVEYKPNIGSRETTYGLIKSGSLTVMPEYNGSLLAYLDAKATPKTEDETNQGVKDKLDPKLTLLDASPAQDKDSLTLNAETAKKLNLTAQSTVGDLKDAASGLVIGGSPEFQTRQQGLKGLESVYGLKFKTFKALDAGGPLTVAALKDNKIQVGDVFTTDASIKTNKFVVLQDDKSLFGFANVVPLAYKSGLSQKGVDALDAVSAKLTTEELQGLLADVQNERKDPLEVASGWLKDKGLS
ncbi:ABC transporter substrate-binding protein [Streptomyces sp. NPDC050560]|uniref:ABC transporter substrate-binding protein n=1 Tax=Streptomyces sp. NPDC050560 TaxID=3365630 RepID=UPI0037BB80B1